METYHFTENKHLTSSSLSRNSSLEHYPGGMLMPLRSYSSNTYRFGFNGKENDNEVKGVGNSQDYGMRIYDPRIIRFNSVDPLTRQFPFYSPYQFAGNKLIWAVDLDGLEELLYTALQTGPNTYIKLVDYTNVRPESSKQWDQQMLNKPNKGIPITRLEYNNIISGKWRNSQKIEGYKQPGGQSQASSTASTPIPQPNASVPVNLPNVNVPAGATVNNTNTTGQLIGYDNNFNIPDNIVVSDGQNNPIYQTGFTQGNQGGSTSVPFSLPNQGTMTLSVIPESVGSQAGVGTLDVTRTIEYTTDKKPTYSGTPGTTGTPGQIDPH